MIRAASRGARLVAMLLALAGLVGGPAGAEIVAVDGISLPPLARALQRHPVQVHGPANPGLSAADLGSLRSLIARRDHDRIWIAVVRPISEQDIGSVANGLSTAINRDGVVIAVGGYNFYIATTWGSGTHARQLLTDAVDRPGDSLAVQLRRAIESFARADAKAGRPTPLADQLAAQSGTGSGTGAAPTATASSPGTTAPRTPASTPARKRQSGGGGGLIVVLIALAVLAVLGLAFGARPLRRRMQASHVRKEEQADTRATVQANFGKLGDGIGELDIDSSMPGASAEGKAEYAQALDCYQDAEKRLKQSDDSYQYDRAVQAINAGLQHLGSAEALFNASGRARDVLTEADIEKLTKLASLHERGILTDAEFAAEKAKLLP